MEKIFSKEELYDRKPRVYQRDASQVRFLLGGIGTGNFSVDARGKSLTGRQRIQNFLFRFLQFG